MRKRETSSPWRGAIRSEYLPESGVITLAHRAGYAGEGSVLEAARRCYSSGTSYFEIDVRSTSDGVPMVWHDKWIPIACGMRKLSECSSSEVGQHQGAVTLSKIMAEFPKVKFSVDLKDRASCRSVPALLCGSEANLSRVCITSFSDTRILLARHRLPAGVCFGVGTGQGLIIVVLATLGRRLRKMDPTAQLVFQVPGRLIHAPWLGSRIANTCIRSGLPLHVWTLNAMSRVVEALDKGVTGVVTDRYAEVSAVIQGYDKASSR